MSSKPESALFAYVPVVSRAYLDLAQKNHDLDEILVADESVTSVLREIQKDLRALQPGEAARLLELYLDRPVRPLGTVGLAELVEYGTHFTMPADDLTERIILDFSINPEQVKKVPLFLRWNRQNIGLNVEINPDKAIELSEIPKDVLFALLAELDSTNDWWRQNAAVLVGNNGVLVGSARNRYLPTDYSGEIDGDIRSQLHRGPAQETYNTIHAEADLIAHCAKAGIKLEGSELYSTTFPCQSCAKLVARSGIQTVTYFDGYAVDDGLPVLKAEGVKIIYVKNGDQILSSRHQLIDRPYPEPIEKS